MCSKIQLISWIIKGTINKINRKYQSNSRLLRKYKEAKRLRPHKTCALMMELRGREIRTSEVVEPVYLKPGSTIYINCDNYLMASTEKVIQCNWRDLPKAVRPNDILYLDDGLIVMLVTDTIEVRIADINEFYV